MGAWNMNRDSASWHEAPLSLLYSVLVAILLGAVLADINYASALRSVLTPDQKLQVYGAVSDSAANMLVAFLALIAGLAGAALAGTNRRARWMLGISVALLLGASVIIPVFLKNVRVDDSPGFGPLVRIVLHVLVVVLAVLATLSWRRSQRYS
jgi:hypothetical protein